jgi:tRNA (mo5U34)-methyltransferase
MQGTALEPWSRVLPEQLEQLATTGQHGDFPRWMEAVGALPRIQADRVDLNRAAPLAETNHPVERGTRQEIERLLQQLHPWRKGPFEIHGIHIDSEWRSDWKWERIVPLLTNLQGRRVLDVGCGNGYHCWRMAGAGAALVIGIDPTQLYMAQFQAIRHFLGSRGPVYLLPLGIETVPSNLRAFDTVFSMGVLYHRRSPIDHLLELKGCLRSEGELVLETLVIEGGEGMTLLPRGRYARMRNVWFLPSPATLGAWLDRCGFRNIRLVDVTRTSIEEQRRTPWMRFESLSDYLMPEDPRQTVEGHPAPVRATFVAGIP